MVGAESRILLAGALVLSFLVLLVQGVQGVQGVQESWAQDSYPPDPSMGLGADSGSSSSCLESLAGDASVWCDNVEMNAHEGTFMDADVEDGELDVGLVKDRVIGVSTHTGEKLTPLSHCYRSPDATVISDRGLIRADPDDPWKCPAFRIWRHRSIAFLTTRGASTKSLANTGSDDSWNENDYWRERRFCYKFRDDPAGGRGWRIDSRAGGNYPLNRTIRSSYGGGWSAFEDGEIHLPCTGSTGYVRNHTERNIRNRAGIEIMPNISNTDGAKVSYARAVYKLRFRSDNAVLRKAYRSWSMRIWGRLRVKGVSNANTYFGHTGSHNDGWHELLNVRARRDSHVADYHWHYASWGMPVFRDETFTFTVYGDYCWDLYHQGVRDGLGDFPSRRRVQRDPYCQGFDRWFPGSGRGKDGIFIDTYSHIQSIEGGYGHGWAGLGGDWDIILTREIYGPPEGMLLSHFRAYKPTLVQEFDGGSARNTRKCRVFSNGQDFYASSEPLGIVDPESDRELVPQDRDFYTYMRNDHLGIIPYNHGGNLSVQRDFVPAFSFHDSAPGDACSG